jgi:hypothetical protein
LLFVCAFEKFRCVRFGSRLETIIASTPKFRPSGSLFNLAGVFRFIPFSPMLLLATRRELPSTWLFSFWVFYLARLLLQGADISCDIGAVTGSKRNSSNRPLSATCKIG